jgi:hypothetical protein
MQKYAGNKKSEAQSVFNAQQSRSQKGRTGLILQDNRPRSAVQHSMPEGLATVQPQANTIESGPQLDSNAAPVQLFGGLTGLAATAGSYILGASAGTMIAATAGVGLLGGLGYLAYSGYKKGKKVAKGIKGAVASGGEGSVGAAIPAAVLDGAKSSAKRGKKKRATAASSHHSVEDDADESLMEAAIPAVLDGPQSLAKRGKKKRAKAASHADSGIEDDADDGSLEAMIMMAKGKGGSAAGKKEAPVVPKLSKGEKDAKKKAQLLAQRELALDHIPLSIKRTDRNFNNAVNSKHQGKAHLTPHGLAPAGNVSIPHGEQLEQGSPNKGVSDLISFTGPNPNNPVAYGGAGVQELRVKAKKIARAKLKGKEDAQHLEVTTSHELKKKFLGKSERNKKLRSFINKDDEHQIRVTAPEDGAHQTIGKRFLVGAGLPDSHDSDSEDDH